MVQIQIAWRLFSELYPALSYVLTVLTGSDGSDRSDDCDVICLVLYI